MLHRNLLAICLSFVLLFGFTALSLAEAPEDPEIPAAVEEITEPAVEEVPTEEPIAQKLLTMEELRILGVELQLTGGRLRKAYNSFSIVPGTIHEIGKEVDKGEIGVAAFLTIFILPIDFTVSRFFGNFMGSYHLGKAGNHLGGASKIFPEEQQLLMARAGKNLGSARSYGLLSNTLFYGGLIGVLVHDYGTSVEDGGEGRSTPYISIGAMAAGYGLRMLSARYAGSAGSLLRQIAVVPLANEPLQALKEVGDKLGGYETAIHTGTGLTILGAGIAVASKGEGTGLKVGLLTAAVGWIVANPVAASEIKAAASKVQEIGDRMMFWNE